MKNILEKKRDYFIYYIARKKSLFLLLNGRQSSVEPICSEDETVSLLTCRWAKSNGCQAGGVLCVAVCESLCVASSQWRC